MMNKMNIDILVLIIMGGLILTLRVCGCDWDWDWEWKWVGFNWVNCLILGGSWLILEWMERRVQE